MKLKKEKRMKIIQMEMISCLVIATTINVAGCVSIRTDQEDEVQRNTEMAQNAQNQDSKEQIDIAADTEMLEQQDLVSVIRADGSDIDYETNTMQIYDEEEGYLTVPFDVELPQHTYEWSNLTTENGIRTYEEQDGITSTAGIDVSKFQGIIDWKQVADSGVSFVIVRLGYRGYGNGALVLDEMAEQNIEGALAAGLEVGVYFFSQAISEEEAIEEADFVLAEIAQYEITYPVVFDTEEIKNDTARTDDLSVAELTAITKTFCESIETAGYDPMIYANAKWLTTKLSLEELQGIPVWYADYQEVPLYPYEFQMWQYSESGTVPGIEGVVDLNLDLRD